MADISSLSSRKREKEKELKTYKSRKSKMQSIKRDLDSDFDGNIANARNFNERTGSNLLLGLQGEELSIRNICFDIDGEKEQSIYNDSKMYDISLDINNEINRCTSEIERLESEIRSLERQIEAAKDAEE